MYEAPGKVTVAPNVLTTIVRLTALEQAGVHGLCAAPPNVRGLLAGGASEEGVFVGVGDDGVEVEVHVVVETSANMLKLGESLQSGITRAIEEMVGMQVSAVNVYIDEVALAAEKPH
jgi:uncharacterized alkaline shock family protein YloU